MSGRIKTVFDLPLERLAAHFTPELSQGYVHLPLPLFEQCIKLYGNARKLHQKMDLVIGSDEHIRFMEEGRKAFNLPPNDHLQAENDKLGAALASYSPYERNIALDAGVRVRLTDVKSAFNVFACGKDVVQGLDNVYRHTDYIQCHRHRRDEEGLPYEGPKSYREWLAVKYRLKTVSDAYEEHIRVLSSTLGAKPALMGI